MQIILLYESVAEQGLLFQTQSIKLEKYVDKNCPKN